MKNINTKKVKELVSEETTPTKTFVNTYTLTFEKVKHLLNFKVKTCKVVLESESEALTEKLTNMLKQGYVLIDMKETGKLKILINR